MNYVLLRKKLLMIRRMTTIFFDANDFDSVYASPGEVPPIKRRNGMIYVGLGNIPVKKDAGETAVRYTYSEIDSEASETDGKSGAESMLHILTEKAPEMSERTETAEYIESSESFEPSKIKQHPEIRTEPSVRESKRSYSVKVTDKKVKTAVKMRRAKKEFLFLTLRLLHAVKVRGVLHLTLLSQCFRRLYGRYMFLDRVL